MHCHQSSFVKFRDFIHDVNNIASIEFGWWSTSLRSPGNLKMRWQSQARTTGAYYPTCTHFKAKPRILTKVLWMLRAALGLTEARNKKNPTLRGGEHLGQNLYRDDDCPTSNPRGEDDLEQPKHIDNTGRQRSFVLITIKHEPRHWAAPKSSQGLHHPEMCRTPEFCSLIGHK